MIRMRPCRLREFEKGRKQVSEKYVGFLAPASDRYEAWIEVLGSNEAPLTSPYPMTASAPGIAQGAFYSLDIAALDDGQRTRLIAYLARRFELPEEEVARAQPRLDAQSWLSTSRSRSSTAQGACEMATIAFCLCLLAGVVAGIVVAEKTR